MISKAKLEYQSNLALTYAHILIILIFQYISSIKGHDYHRTQMFYNDKQATTDSEKAQLFNHYFYSVYSSSDQLINDYDITTSHSSDTLQDIAIFQSDVIGNSYIP